MNKMTLFTTVAVLTGLSAAQASVIVYEDMADWSNAVGDHATIDFTDGTLGEFINDHYSHYGIGFSEDTIFYQNGFFTDIWGFTGLLQIGTTIFFDTPQQWFGIDHVGHLLVDFYSGDDLVWSSNILVPPSGENLAFAGFVLPISFDSVYLYRLGVDNVAVIDNIYFAVPAPGALGLLLLAGAAATRRRRHA
jgi:hypothetical protein